MNYFKYLKKSFFVYIISGVLLGLAVMALVTVHRYNGSLNNSLESLKTMNLKEEEILREIDQIDAVTNYFHSAFGVTDEGVNPEKLIMHALDDLKTHIAGSFITTSKFEEADGEKRLPVEIKLPVNNYRTIIEYVGYVEAFRLPDLRIKTLTVIKEETGGVILNIQGNFVVPHTGGSI